MRTFCSAEKRDRAIAELAFLVLALAAIGAVLAGGVESAVALWTQKLYLLYETKGKDLIAAPCLIRPRRQGDF